MILSLDCDKKLIDCDTRDLRYRIVYSVRVYTSNSMTLRFGVREVRTKCRKNYCYLTRMHGYDFTKPSTATVLRRACISSV